MKKIKKLALLLTLLGLMLTGCTNLSTNKLNSNEPIFSDEVEKINKILADATYSKSNLKLIAPKSGKHQLAVNKFTDKLNRTFAVVFHKNKFKQTNFQNNLRMSILQKSKANNWHSLVNLPCQGQDVDKIIFFQNENNDNAFLVVGFEDIPSDKVLKLHRNHFCIYELDPNNFHSIPVEKPPNLTHLEKKYYPYEALEPVSFDSSNECKLVSISRPYVNKDKLELNIFEFNPELKKIRPTANLDVSDCIANSNYEIKLDKKSFNKPAIFIDFKHDYLDGTSIFLVDKANGSEKNSNLNSRINIKEIYSNRVIDLNNPSILSFDFDNDGRLEVAQNSPFPGYKIINNAVVPIEKDSKIDFSDHLNHTTFSINSKISNPPQITYWLKFHIDNDKLKQHAIPTYTNFTQGYGLYIPDNWLNKVSARYINQNKTIEFFEFDQNIYCNKNKILTLTTCPLNEHPPNGFFVLKTRGPFLFMAKLNNSNYSGDKNLLISKNKLEQMFFLIQSNVNLNDVNHKEGDQN